MKRREFVTLLGGAAVWPLAVRAQQSGLLVREAGDVPAGSCEPQPVSGMADAH